MVPEYCISSCHVYLAGETISSGSLATFAPKPQNPGGVRHTLAVWPSLRVLSGTAQ